MVDVLVVGAGPGGYVAAIRAAQLGLSVALVEKDNVGGVCLNWGCIPSKALIHNAEVIGHFQHARDYGVTVDSMTIDFGPAIDRSRQVSSRIVKGVEYLVRKNKLDLIKGTARLVGRGKVVVDADRQGREVEATHIIVATGGRPMVLPGLEPDGGKQVLTSYEALAMKELPKRIVIIGGGAIGCEFAYVWHTYGVDVTIVEMLPHLLPREDAEISAQVEDSFKRRGIKFRTGTKVERVDRSADPLTLTVSKDGQQEALTADKILLSVGWSPNSAGLGLEELGVELQRGYIAVGDQLQTNVPGIYAIGDVTGKLALAHVASAQGVACVEAIAGRPTSPLRYVDMPRCTYCSPQVASMGLTEAQAREAGHDVKVGTFPLRVLGKALAQNEAIGLAKIVTDAKYGEILGAHIVGPSATELIPELTLARMLEATAEEVGRNVHPHPTISEGVMEAALGALGHAIHI
ncbi:MAG: dihydrolipoyl dehydrogenase [Chloroflexi bacterium]|nr:dihydrolipoyl dehydrogenase [Chloroflexota bacterium]